MPVTMFVTPTLSVAAGIPALHLLARLGVGGRRSQTRYPQALWTACG